MSEKKKGRPRVRKRGAEARKDQDGLVRKDRLRKVVERHDPFIVRASEIVEKLGGNGEDGEVLDVGVVFCGGRLVKQRNGGKGVA